MNVFLRSKEIYAHLLAYNLLRTLMWQAAKKADVSPLRVSLQGNRQHFGNFLSKFADAGTKNCKRFYRTLLQVVTHKLVPVRSTRCEPRLKKQRPKPYGWMQQPRHVLKRKLAA
jgi:hypothetical protein